MSERPIMRLSALETPEGLQAFEADLIEKTLAATLKAKDPAKKLSLTMARDLQLVTAQTMHKGIMQELSPPAVMALLITNLSTALAQIMAPVISIGAFSKGDALRLLGKELDQFQTATDTYLSEHKEIQLPERSADAKR